MSVVDLIKAVDFAARKHRDQRRKDQQATPYINHPIGVAHILAHEGGVEDIAILQAALLHDTVEDTDTTLEEIKVEFGEKVASIVAEVTDDKTLTKGERKRLQVENAHKKSHEAKLVKLADKLYNLRDIVRTVPDSWTEERAQEYFVWASNVISGLRGTNPILEAKLGEVLAVRNVILPARG